MHTEDSVASVGSDILVWDSEKDAQGVQIVILYSFMLPWPTKYLVQAWRDGVPFAQSKELRWEDAEKFSEPGVSTATFISMLEPLFGSST